MNPNQSNLTDEPANPEGAPAHSTDLSGIPPKLSATDYLWIVLASFALGILVSLSASPVMQIIVTSIVALLAGFVVTWIVTREFVPNAATAGGAEALLEDRDGRR